MAAVRFTASDGVSWTAEVRTEHGMPSKLPRSIPGPLGQRTWLYFTSRLGTRRLEVFPLNWRDLTGGEFEVLLRVSDPVPR